ncbi:MAG TPA: PIN domain-containing protein [Anaeromyxobacteraceae bacterium]|jgi:predicted nucleic acid-binding protein
MALLLDSSVIVAAERGRLDLDAVLAGREDEDVAISTVTASELLHGVHRAAGRGRRAAREAFVERVLAVLPAIPFDLVAARVHARLWAELAARGAAVGAHDLVIAATAIATSRKVATRDLRSFPRIPGLAVVRM